MNTQSRSPLPAAFRIAGLGVVSLLLIAAVVGWSHFGSDILLDAAASGLSWCF